MKIEPGQTALVTGASRGMGVIMARALARRGVRLIIAARNAAQLEQVARQLEAECQVSVTAIAADLGNSADLARLADEVGKRGGVDILLNNAGVEDACSYEQRDPAGIEQMIAVNLTGPMLLSRLLLPGMLGRGRGHIVNVASVAGMLASPYQEPYCATKAGLIGFTRALRMTAQDQKWPVSASLLSPGFMAGAGMYEDMHREHSVKAHALLGTVSAEQMGPALLRAIEQDLPDVVLMKGTPRLNAAISAMAPRLFERIMAWFDFGAVFRTVAQRRTAG
jgi:short-subunit dehydrogenase